MKTDVLLCGKCEGEIAVDEVAVALPTMFVHEWCTDEGGPQCVAEYDGKFWTPRPCREPAGHDGFHADCYGRTWQ
jgi:hypothetical protein